MVESNLVVINFYHVLLFIKDINKTISKNVKINQIFIFLSKKINFKNII